MYYSYVKIEYLATSFSPARTDLALKLLSIPFVLLDDIIVTSLVLLNDVVLASLESLAIVVGVAFIGLGGVKLVCTTVSLNVTNFLVLPDPTPYSDSESLSS
jgi:hypothetical protein